MSSSERHQLEKAALDDPFLADAIDGYSSTNVNIQADLKELADRLNNREEKARVIALPKKSTAGFPWLRAAAMIIILLVAGWAVYQFAWNDEKNEIAKNTESTTNNTTPDTSRVEQSQAITETTNPVNKEAEQSNIASTLSAPQQDYKRTEEKPVIVEQQKTEPDADLKEQIVAAAPTKDRDIVSTPPVANHAEEKEVQQNDKKIAAAQRKADEEKKLQSSVMVEPNRQQRNTEPAAIPDYYNTRVFRGQVTDDQNNPLPFVNITNTRDNVGTYTDARGNFSLVSTDSILDVQVRSLGYENTRAMLRSDEETSRIHLQEDRNITARVLDTVKRNYTRARGNNLRFEEPEPADGWDYYDSYLVNNLNVPETFLRKRADQTASGGEVELSFEVNRHGEPINIKVEKSLCEQCDKEAIRLVKQGPKWKRKAKKGRTRVMVPFY